VGRTINIDTATGKVKNDPEAMSHWKREYQQGWEPTV